VHIQEVVSTIYHNFGLGMKTIQPLDQAGQPQYLPGQREPIRELVG